MPGRKVYVVGVGMTKVKYTLIILHWIWSEIRSRKLQICLFPHSVARLQWLLSEILPCYDQYISRKITIISISNRANRCVEGVFKVFSLQFGCTRVYQVIPKKEIYFLLPFHLPPPHALSKLAPFSFEKWKSLYFKFSRLVFYLNFIKQICVPTISAHALSLGSFLRQESSLHVVVHKLVVGTHTLFGKTQQLACIPSLEGRG